jgi:hypothetical protein
MQMKNAYLQHKHHGEELRLLHLCTPSLLHVAAVAGKMTIVRYHHNKQGKTSKKVENNIKGKNINLHAR